MRKHATLLILLTAVAVFSFADLGKWALMDADEATYARVFHESAQKADLLSFTYLGEPWFEKPPLYFWLTRISVAAFGENEFAFRFPSAVSIVLAVWLVWLITYHESKDGFTALLSGIILLSTGYFMFAGRQLRLDVPVTAATLFSFYCFLRGIAGKKWLLGVGLGIAGGILMKSVVGLLALPFVLIYSLFHKHWAWLKNRWFWLGNAIAAVVVLPWHLYEYAKFGEPFWRSYFVFNVMERVSGVVLTGKETAPFFYHLKQLFVVANPWFSVFLVLGCVALMMKLSGLNNSGVILARPYFAIVVFTIVLFYIPQTRLLYYFLPALPFLAICIALCLKSPLVRRPYITGPALFILCAIGLGNTFFQIFSQVERGFFLQPLPKVSRYQVAEDEKMVALIRRKENLPLFVYKWNFVTTLLYYNDGGNGTSLLRTSDGATIEPPALLLIPSPLFKGLKSLPSAFSQHAEAELLYAGRAATLVRISER